MDGQVLLQDIHSSPSRRIGSFNPGANPRFTVIALIATQLAQQSSLTPNQITKLLLSPPFRPAMIEMTDRFAPHMTLERPSEPETKAQRRKANLEAMKVLESPLGRAVATKLYRFTGWGGLSLDEVQDIIPHRQDKLALIHEWYTPSQVADAVAERVAPLLDKLVNKIGIVKALEPSAGVGRFIDSFNRARSDLSIRWTAVELNQVSARILHKLHPYTHVHMGPYEAYNREYGDTRFDLVVANPPFGSQAKTRIYASLDPDDRFREPFDYAYFIKRSIAALRRCGIGVFVIPRSFMSGASKYNVSLRSYTFRRLHLLSAFRLPSTGPGSRRLFPEQDVVVDVVIAQSRGGVLVAESPKDKDLIAGKYFETAPENILGVEGTNSRGRYSVATDEAFEALPEVTPRPDCPNCAIEPEQPPRVKRTTPTDELDPHLAFAVSLGDRVGDYLRGVARGEDVSDAWEELQTGLSDLRSLRNPWQWPELRRLAESGNNAAQGLLRGFQKDGTVSEALRVEPKLDTRGLAAEDVVNLAQTLAPVGGVDPAELFKLHRSLGGKRSVDELTQALLSSGFMFDDGRLFPEWEYLSGDLWEKHDTVPEGEQGERQRAAILARIKPAVFEDLEVDPRLTWVPIEVVRMWLVNDQKHEGLAISRTEGVLRASTGRNFAAEQAVNWLNHMSFRPQEEPPLEKSKYPDAIVEELESLEAEGQGMTSAIRRRLWGIFYLDRFREWIGTEPGAQDLLVDAYNRSFKGFVLPEFDDSPLHIDRWTQDPNLQLRPHQVRAVKARVATRGGILALAVGAGKTFTSLAVIALGRQQGWIKRPVVVVPAGIVWQWYDEVARVLPDYRVGVVGSKRYVGKSGKSKGKLTSTTATADERAAQWLNFQAGLYDLVLLTDTSLGTTRLTPEELEAYAKQRDAMMRSLYISRKKAKGKKKEKQSERDRAILEYGARAWVEEILELKKRVHDPGVRWADLGIDFLVYDETGNIRRTWSPAPREFGMPKYMGGSHKGSQRGWQADFRAALVRMNGGGVLALSGTVGENSPAEPFNLLHFIDPAIMERVGISDVEQFLSRYVVIGSKRIMKPTGERKVEDAVVGFKNLNELRNILYTWGNFVSHEQAGIKLPESEELLVEVEMSDSQREIYEVHRMRAQKALKKRQSNSVFSALSRMREVTVHELLGGEGYSWPTAYGGLAKKEVSEKALEFYEKRGWKLSENELKRKISDENNESVSTDLHAKLKRLQTSQKKSGMYKVEKQLPKPRTFTSAKIEACAERIAENLTCAHIVFVESTAAHAWLTETLVSKKVPRNRIAVINGYTGDVSEITRKFNGSEDEERSLDVVITNSKGTRGVNLQRETCMLHNLDLRWTPADMEQRRGRIDRFGNTMPLISIVFYFANNSFDGFMFDILAGKGSWRDSLFLREGDRSINPAAQLDLGDAELFMLTARNKAEALELKKMIEQEAEARRLYQAGKRALKLFAQIAGRIRFASMVPEPEASRLRAEAQEYMESLDKVDVRAWPWKQANKDMMTGDPRREWSVGASTKIPPYYPGVVLVQPDQVVLQIGEILPNGRVGVRRNGEAEWKDMSAEHLTNASYSASPASDELVGAETAATFVHTWHRAHERWVMKMWSKFLEHIVKTLKSEGSDVPVFGIKTGLTLDTAVSKGDRRKILPPTKTAWEVFRAWAPVSSAPQDRLEVVARTWFGRELTLPPHKQSVVDREKGKFSFQELDCSNRILAIAPSRFCGVVAREFKRISELPEDTTEVAINIQPGISLRVVVRDYKSPDDLRRSLLRLLFREYLGKWSRIVRAQQQLLQGDIVADLDHLFYDLQEMDTQVGKILGHANARLFRVCAQQGSLDPRPSVAVKAAMFPAAIRSQLKGVSKARVTEETETFVPVFDGQFLTIKKIEIATGNVDEVASRAPGNLFAQQYTDTLRGLIPIQQGQLWLYSVKKEGNSAVVDAWVNVHPSDLKAVLGDVSIDQAKKRSAQPQIPADWYPRVSREFKAKGLRGTVHVLRPDPNTPLRFDETGTYALYGRGVLGIVGDRLFYVDADSLVPLGIVRGARKAAITAAVRRAVALELNKADRNVDLTTSRYLRFAGSQQRVRFSNKEVNISMANDALRREQQTGVVTYKDGEWLLEVRITAAHNNNNIEVQWVNYTKNTLLSHASETRPFNVIRDEVTRLGLYRFKRFEPDYLYQQVKHFVRRSKTSPLFVRALAGAYLWDHEAKAARDAVSKWLTTIRERMTSLGLPTQNTETEVDDKDRESVEALVFEKQFNLQIDDFTPDQLTPAERILTQLRAKLTK